MAFQPTPYLFPLLGSAVASLLVAGVGLRHRDCAGARALAALMLALTWWSLANAVALATTALPLKVRAYKITYPAIAVVPVAWLLFSVRYTGRFRPPSRREVGALLVVPALSVLLAWTNEYHCLFWSSIELVSRGSFVYMTSAKGPGFWMHAAYSYALMAVGTGLILRTAVFSGRIYRDQAAGLALAALLPWGGNVLFLAGLTGVFDPTNLGFAFSGVVLIGVILRRRLLRVAPAAREIARDEIINSMVEAVLVVDEHGQVVDLNPAAEAVAGGSASEVVGRPLEDVLPAVAEFRDSVTAGSTERTELALEVDGAERTYDVRATPLRRGYGAITGQLVTLNDVTEQRERERQIERQRQRLAVT